MPRIRAEPLASEPVDETSSDGAIWLSWRMSFAPLFCSDSADTALTATGTSDNSCERPCAITTMSPLSAAASAACWSLVCGVCGASCASAGEDSAPRLADTKSAPMVARDTLLRISLSNLFQNAPGLPVSRRFFPNRLYEMTVRLQSGGNAKSYYSTERDISAT
jgi:hypothetical protein